MLFLNKLLPIFALPLGLSVMLIVVGLLFKRRWLIWAAVVLLYVPSLPFIGNRLLGWLETRHAAVPVAQAGPADAVVVLGGIFGPPVTAGYLANISESGERLEAGIQLTQSSRAPWLVFTGAKIPWEGRDVIEGEDSRRAAVARGVPAGKILITREIGNTADEARAVAELMQARGWKRIILVTTGWHMPRAARLFRHAGVDFTPFPVDFRIDPHRPLTLLDFLPNAGALANTETALRECYGMAFYALTGR